MEIKFSSIFGPIFTMTASSNVTLRLYLTTIISCGLSDIDSAFSYLLPIVGECLEYVKYNAI